MRRLFLLLGLPLLGTLLGLVVAEGALRLLAPRRAVFELRGLHEFRPDQPWLYGLRPGAEGQLESTGDAFYRINADGFRGPVYARPKPEGVRRVVVMGDSIAFGYGVQEDETFPQQLEMLLAELLPDAGIEVIGLGVGGYNAFNEARLLEGIGLSYQPDLVLVQFCINDLNDPSMHFDAQTRVVLSAIPDDAFPDPSQRRGVTEGPPRALAWCRASKLCAATHDLWLAARATEFGDEARQDAVRPIEGDAGPEWSWLESRYLEMATAADRAGARFAVLAFPYRAQLSGEERHSVQERLVALRGSRGWTVVDPLPAFRHARARGKRLFLDWWHPTAAGHRLAAQETLSALACAGELGIEARRHACLRGPDATTGGE